MCRRNINAIVRQITDEQGRETEHFGLGGLILLAAVILISHQFMNAAGRSCRGDK